jgi:branched-chain amino acid transport system substrate-binding protein
VSARLLESEPVIRRSAWLIRGSNRRIAVAAVAVVVSACGSSSPSNPTSAASGAAAGKTFTIPYVVTLTGSFAPLLATQKDAIHLAIQDINAAGGVNGHPLAVNQVDDGGTPQGAIEAVRKLLPGALFVLSSTPTNSAQGSFPVANQSQTVIYGCCITTASVVTGNRPNTFTGWPDTAKAAGALATAFLAGHANVKTMSMILDTSDSAAKSQGALVQKELQDRGVKVLDPIAVQTSQLDFSAPVAKLRDQHADAVLIATEANASGVILKQEKSVGMSVPNVGTRSTWSPDVVPKVAGAAGLADYWTYEFFSPDSSAAAKKFTAEYQQATGRAVDTTSAFAYEAVYLFADLLKGFNLDATGSELTAQRAKLQQKLEGLKDYKGIFGPLSFSNGIATRQIYALSGDASGTMHLTPTG